MALFQPTNITPDVRAGLGLGVIDTDDGLTVTWRITGASALTAFSISVYLNDSTSTLKYSTGKLTTNCPAYGTTSTGQIQPFSYSISAATLASSSITNGNEYKLIITQYWESGGTEYSVQQSSASVFITRATPTLSITKTDGTALPSTIDERIYSFAGQYAQAQNDVVSWFQWTISANGESNDIVFDSGKIYGTQDIQCSFDGFFSGMVYTIQLVLQTENGITVSDTKDFTVSYGVFIDDYYPLTATCMADTDAIKISTYAYTREISGTWTVDVEDGIATINHEISWSTTSLLINNPWSIIWRGTYSYDDSDPDNVNITVFKATMVGNWYVSVQIEANGVAKLIYGFGNNTILSTKTLPLQQENKYALALTPTKLYIAHYEEQIETLGKYKWQLYSVFDFNYIQRKIVSFKLGPTQECEYFEISYGELTQQSLNSKVLSEKLKNIDYDGCYLYSDWKDYDNGKALSRALSNPLPMTLYKKAKGESVLTKIAGVPPVAQTYYDYSAVNQNSEIQYYLLTDEATSFIGDVFVYDMNLSNKVTPCWWNWTLTECAETDNSNIFVVLAAYKFRLGIETDAISNNNQPNILQNFTPYPKVQLTPQNYKSGTLTALIGYIDWTGKQPEYKDTIALRDALYALSVTQNALFLKNRKGDLIRVRVSAPITMTTADATKEQTQTMALPWVEVGSAKGVSLYATSYVQR